MLYPLPKRSIAASAPMRFAPLNPLLFSPKCKTKRIRVQNAHRNDSQVIEKARWRSGDAADCKSVYAGSIPARASKHRMSAHWRPAPAPKSR